MIALRQYQTKIIDATRALMKPGEDKQPLNRRVIMNMATGAGKTLTSAWIADAVVKNGKRAVFVVRGRDLVFQAQRAYEAMGIHAAVLMAGTPYDKGAPVQVASVDTLRSRLAYLDWLEADLLVTDEAHESITDSFKAVRQRFPNAFEVGLTATPARGDGQSLYPTFTAMTTGPSYQDLISQGFLVPPVYYGVPRVEADKLKMNSSGEFTDSTMHDAYKKFVLSGEIIPHYKRFAEGRPFMLFAPSVAHSQLFSEQFNRAGYTTAHIDASTPREVREAAYEAVGKGEVDGLLNFGVFTKGTDIPAVSCIIFARDFNHITGWVQALGRGLRPFEGKRDCVVIDHGENVQRHGCVVVDPVEWSLEPSFNAAKERKAKRAREERELTCRHCAFVFRAAAKCPNCGTEPWQSQKDAAAPLVRDVDLAEIHMTPNERYRRASMDDKARIWSELVCFGKRKNYNNPEGFAFFKYQDYFGVQPHQRVKDMFTLTTPSADLVAWIKAEQRAYAIRKGYSKNKRRQTLDEELFNAA